MAGLFELKKALAHLYLVDKVTHCLLVGAMMYY